MKTEYIRVRLNSVEKQIIKKNAESFSMNISDYVRYCCLVSPPTYELFLRKENKEIIEE